MNYSKKRKRVVVSVGEKLSALSKIDNGEPVLKVAGELGVSENTVRDWKKNRTKLETFSSKVDGSLLSRRTLKKPKHNNVDEALWLWFVEEQKKGITVTGSMLKEKALIFEANMSNKSNFTASNGWLARWKKRHGIHQKENPGDDNKEELNTSCFFIENSLESNSSLTNINCIKKESEEECTSSVLCHISDNDKDEFFENIEAQSEDHVSHTEGKEALSLALKYVKQQPDATLIDVLLIKKWLDYSSNHL